MAIPVQTSVQPNAASAVPGEGPIDKSDAQHLAWLTSKSAQQPATPYHYLLLLRFALINIVGIALLGATQMQGLIEKVMVADQTYLSAVIFLVFACGLGISAVKAWGLSQELNQVKSFDPLRRSKAAEYLAQIRGRESDSRGIIASALKMKLAHRIAIVRQIAGSLVILGLIGTVVGFIIALSGVRPDQAADVKAITPMVSTLIAGMSTALYTTLVGSVLNVWLMVNYQLLAGGTIKLITGLIEFGEEHVSDR
jgi:biopolymer transport protein ExbB/TolQ